MIPPKYLEEGGAVLEHFKTSIQQGYSQYREAIDLEIELFKRTHDGLAPKGMAFKRILEAASSLLHHTVETSWIWTTNPGAIAKLMLERDSDLADREFQRFASVWKKLVVSDAPNLFPQPWMQPG